MLACMIDVEFVTLGIIRCNIEDSGVIALERLVGDRKLFDSYRCFMVLCSCSFAPEFCPSP